MYAKWWNKHSAVPVLVVVSQPALAFALATVRPVRNPSSTPMLLLLLLVVLLCVFGSIWAALCSISLIPRSGEGVMSSTVSSGTSTYSVST